VQQLILSACSLQRWQDVQNPLLAAFCICIKVAVGKAQRCPG